MKEHNRRNLIMLQRVGRAVALVSALLFGSAAATSGQQVATAPDSTAGIQYVATTCGGGAPCSDVNSGLSWGAAKATIAGAQSALLALSHPGGIIHVAPGYAASFSSQLVLGNSSNVHITIVAGNNVVLTYTGHTSCGILLHNETGLFSYGGSNSNSPLLQLANGATAPVLCTDPTVQGYYSIKGWSFEGNGATNQSSALVQLNAVADGSRLADVTMSNWGGPLLLLQDEPAFSFGPFMCERCVLNGEALSGAIPLKIYDPPEGESMVDMTFLNGSVTHAGPGLQEVLADSQTTSIEGLSFLGTYCENSYASSDCFDFNNVGFELVGVKVDGMAGINVVKISGARAQASVIINLLNVSAYTNLLNDTTNSVTYPGTDSSIPFYVYAPPGYSYPIGVPSLSIASGSPVTNSGAGGTMASSGPNGISAGSCSTGSSGSCSHTFSTPYSAAPVCTTTGSTVVVNATEVTVKGATNSVLNWICYPTTN